MVREEQSACFVVRDQNGLALAYVYFGNEPGRRSAAKLLAGDEAQRTAFRQTGKAARFAKLNRKKRKPPIEAALKFLPDVTNHSTSSCSHGGEDNRHSSDDGSSDGDSRSSDDGNSDDDDSRTTLQLGPCCWPRLRQ